MQLRKLWFNIHLYISLVLGVVIVLIGLTGSIITFDKEIDRLLNPELLTVQPQGQQRQMMEIVAAAKALHPEKIAGGVNPPLAEDEVAMVWFRVPEPVVPGMEEDKHACCKGIWHQVMVNPYTAQILGSRDTSKYGLNSEYFIRTMHHLHSRVLLGEWGKNFIGIVGILWLIVCFTGVYLWWPKLAKLKLALSIKRGAGNARFIFDLHRATGIYSVIVLVVVTFSGVYFIFPNYVRPMVGVFSPVPEPLAKVESAIQPGARAISVEEAVTIGSRIFPDAGLRRVGLPGDQSGSYRISMRQEGEVGSASRAATSVWIDQYSGKVLEVHDSQKMTGGEVFLAWQMPLHNGTAFGLTGRIIIFASGIVPLILAATGTLMWLRKRRARRQKALVAENATAAGRELGLAAGEGGLA
jgi:uncharacterized iron-regulated membrane protein